MADLRAKLYGALERLAELDTDKAGEWNALKESAKEYLHEVENKASVETAKKNGLIEEMTSLEKRASTMEAELKSAQEQLGASGNDERVSLLEQKLQEERSNSEKAIAELKSGYTKEKIRNIYSEALNIEPEVKEMVLDKITRMQFEEGDGVYKLVLDGETKTHNDHIKQLQEQYSKYSVTKAGGDTTPNADETPAQQSDVPDFVAQAKAALAERGAVPMMSGSATI